MAAARRRLPATVYALGLVSFFTDLASEMIVPLLPALFAAIGADMLALGLLIGTSDLAVALLRLVSGALSDRVRRRKPWVLSGYALSALVRPLFALVATPWQAIAVRTGDRVGKGLRSAPRDALVADVVDARDRGRAFGVQRAMDHAGAFAGGMLAFLLLWQEVELRTVFALALLPGLVGVAVVVAGVRDAAAAGGAAAVAADPPGALRRLSPFLGVVALGAVAVSVDLFALRRAQDLGVGVAQLPLLWVVLHAVRALLAGRLGALSDRLGRRAVIAMGLAAHALVLLGFVFAADAALMWPLFALLGLHAAFTEGAERGYVADLTGAGRRGTAFGVYHAVQGLAAFAGPVALGGVWDAVGAPAAFGLAAGATALALLLLAFVPRPRADHDR